MRAKIQAGIADACERLVDEGGFEQAGERYRITDAGRADLERMLPQVRDVRPYASQSMTS